MFENFINNEKLWYKTSDNSLFPLPLLNSDKFVSKKHENLKLFLILGYVIARGIYDDRLIDIPLNALFWDIVLEKVILVLINLFKFL